ncbi:MAG: IS630 family transposase [Acidimicrobiales bacterium]
MGKRVLVSSTTGKRTRIPRRELAETRRKVIGAIEKGYSPEEAAEIFDCGRSTVYGWLSAHRWQGERSFEVKKPSGRPSLLTKRQTSQLHKWVVGKDPRQLRFELALWTRDMVRTLIAERFGVQMSRTGVGKLLRRIGLSPQRPLVAAYEQDPEAVRRWKQEEYPKIAAKAKVVGAQIFFCDEAGVRTDHHTGTTWGEVGKTPVVRATGKRASLNMVSAISAKGKLHFSFAGRINSDSFIEYLRKLLHDVSGKIFLVVDGHSAHTAGKTKQFVASTKGRLQLIYLPSYSPELNPDEWVWKNIKHDRVGRSAPHGIEEMKELVQKAVDRLQSCKEIVRGFFRSPDLAYISI